MAMRGCGRRSRPSATPAARVFGGVSQRCNRRYAGDLLARIRTLATKAGDPDRFADLLAGVTCEHARKRSLVALIDKERWTSARPVIEVPTEVIDYHGTRREVFPGLLARDIQLSEQDFECSRRRRRTRRAESRRLKHR